MRGDLGVVKTEIIPKEEGEFDCHIRVFTIYTNDYNNLNL